MSYKTHERVPRLLNEKGELIMEVQKWNPSIPNNCKNIIKLDKNKTLAKMILLKKWKIMNFGDSQLANGLTKWCNDWMIW